MSSTFRFAATLLLLFLGMTGAACRIEAPSAEQYFGETDGASTGLEEPAQATSSSTPSGTDTADMDESAGTSDGTDTSTNEGSDTSADGSPPDPVCGDGIVDGTEACDDERESARCDGDCTLPACGDGWINASVGEACDTVELGGASCTSMGFDGGTLGCDAACQLDATHCEACGDGIVGPGESCDGTELGGVTCEGMGFDGGVVVCNAACEADVTGCHVCGNSVTETAEQCDDGGESAACDADCTLVSCGDGTLNESAHEECDHAGESAFCNSSCTIHICGDGITNASAGEECDDMGPSTSCDSDCTFIECGDFVVNPVAGEQCEGADLGGSTCVDHDFDGGVLACNSSCQLDTAGCFECGDGTVDPGEACDGTDSGGSTCATLGFDGGTLGCTPGCGHETSQCYVDPTRCLDIHTIDPAAPSGTYELDVDGAGPLPAFLAYCDMDTDGGGWTELTLALGCTLGAEMIAVIAAPTAGIDAECRPYTQDTAGGHTYHYTIPFPAGFSQIMPIDYVARANAAIADTSDLASSASFVQTSWDLAYLLGGQGDISFGAAEDAGPNASFARAVVSGSTCQSCDLVYPESEIIYTLSAESQALRIGWGEHGGQSEGWYPWWSGTFRVR